MKEIKRSSKWRDTLCLWIESLNIKMLIFLKLICRFNTSTIKIPAGYFVKIDKLILKFKWEDKETRMEKIIEKEECWHLYYLILRCAVKLQQSREYGTDRRINI